MKRAAFQATGLQFYLMHEVLYIITVHIEIWVSLHFVNILPIILMTSTQLNNCHFDFPIFVISSLSLCLNVMASTQTQNRCHTYNIEFK